MLNTIFVLLSPEHIGSHKGNDLQNLGRSMGNEPRTQNY